MAEDEFIVVDTDDRNVVTVTLSDPSRKNALSISMKESLRDTLHSLDSDSVRCLVLQGAGDSFSAGGDIDRMEKRMKSTSKSSLESMRESLELTNAIISTIAGFPAPVVVKIDGPAVGGGASIAIAGDIRLATDEATIGFVFRHVGLSVDGGSSYHLPRLVGLDRAKELAFSGRIVDAEEANDIGLVHRVIESDAFDEQCDAVITELASGPTEAFSHMKTLLNRSSNKTLEQALEDELVAQATLLDTADHREGVRAFLEDRNPNFSGR